MSPRRFAALAAHELRLARRDPGLVVQLVLMPLLMIAFFAPLYRDGLRAQGYADASGAEQAVPGMAALFAFFLVGFVGFGLMRERNWGTWQRLRASAASAGELMAAKCLVPMVIALAQQVVLFAAGVVLLDLRIAGSVLALGAMTLALTCCLVCLGVLAAGLVRDEQRLNALTSVGTMVMGGLGGALAPVALMPAWAQAVAPATPTYWAVDGYRSVVLDGAGLADVARPVLVLLALAAVFAALGTSRLRADLARTA